MEYISAKDTAAGIRAALKTEFVGIKFSVRTNSYSGGASITVTWTDGPPQKHVEAITDGFEGKGSLDLNDHCPSKTGALNGEPVHFLADYVFTVRNVGEETAKALEHELAAALGETELNAYASYPVPNLIYRACPEYHYNMGTIGDFVNILSQARAA